MSSRPENLLPAEYVLSHFELFSSITIKIKLKNIPSKLEFQIFNHNLQVNIAITTSERAIELLNLDEQSSTGSIILDIGCGSGLSGEILTENGFVWIGIDISRDMLNVAVQNSTEGELFQVDMGQGFQFRPGTFDAAISISALQWLCVAGKKSDNPQNRLFVFFQSLYNSLKQNGRAVLQFYPDNSQQIDMITKQALRAGFSGGIIVDFPNSTRAKKMYLVIDAGAQEKQEIIMKTGLEDEVRDEEQKIKTVQRNKAIRKFKNRQNKKPDAKSKKWIEKKKERMRKQGKKVKNDSKYSGRRRSVLKLMK